MKAIAEVQRENQLLRSYQNTVYAMWLNNGILKIGFTSNVQKRMTYHRQEARRHGVKRGHWWSCAGFSTRNEARAMESLVLRQFAGLQLKGSREWFSCDADTFAKVMSFMETVRSALFTGPTELAQDLPYIGTTNYWNEATT